MKQVTNFDGTLKVQVSQVQPYQDEKGKIQEDIIHYEMVIHGFKKLTTNHLAGTIAREMFAAIEAQRFAGIRLLKANLPVVLKITNGQGQMIADTTKMSKAFSAKLRVHSEKSFAKCLFAGLSYMTHKAQITPLANVLGDTSAKNLQFIDAQSVVLWEKTPTKKGQKALPVPVEVIEEENEG